MNTAAGDRTARANTRGPRKGPANRLRVYLARHAQVFFYSLGRLAGAPFATFMTAAVIGIALALPSGLHVILDNVQQLSDGWGGATQISVFLRNGTSQKSARELVKQLSRMPEIDEVHYISPDQALEEFKRFSGFGDALKALEENPLPGVVVIQPSLQHSGTDARQRLITRLGELREVDLAQSDMQWIQRLYAIIDIVERGVAVLAVLLAMAVVLVIGNTIRLAIQNRRDEIIVIKLIGGTDAFIRRPFLYSGFWYGVFGGILAFALVNGAVAVLSNPVEHLAGLYRSEFELGGLDVAGAASVLLVSITLGLAGSWLAVGRHLREIEPT